MELISKELTISKYYRSEFKYLYNDLNDEYLTNGNLQDRTILRKQHKQKIIESQYLNGKEENKIINEQTRLIIKLNKQDLICLKGRKRSSDIMENENNNWGLPYIKNTIRDITQMYNLAITIQGNNDLTQFDKIWELVYRLIEYHCYDKKNITHISEIVMHDTILILKYLIQIGKATELQRSYDNSSKPESLHWFKGLKSLYHKSITHKIPKRQLITKLMIYDKESYEKSTKTTATLYGIKINSETTKFGKKKDLKQFGIEKGELWIANKRNNNFGENNPDIDVERLLQNHGYEPTNLVHDVFSPTSWAIIMSLHNPTRHTNILKRKLLSHIPEHFGRSKLLAKIQQKYTILAAQKICDIIITMCKVCKMRNNNTEISQESRLPLFLLENNPRPYSVTHIDIAGPAKILVNQGSIVTRNQKITSCYFLVCVCSLTKHTQIIMMQGTDTASAALALSALISRVGQPQLIIADSQSSFVKLMRENSTITQNDEIIEIRSIAIKLVPVGKMGHKSAGSVEKKIDLLRRLIGNFDFTKTSLSIANLQNLISTAQGCMNRTPIGIRKSGKTITTITSSPLIKFITPQILYDPRNTRSSESFLTIEKDINEYMETNKKLIIFITDIMKHYLIEIQNSGTAQNKEFTDIKTGDIVAFRTVDHMFHNYHHPYTMGIIHSTSPNPIDNQIRTVKISYIARPGEKLVINGTQQIITKGQQYITTRPVGTLIKLCGYNEAEEGFRLDAIRTEKCINEYTRYTDPTWRPETFIMSNLSTDCKKYLQSIQASILIDTPENKVFITPEEKLHITHLTMEGKPTLNTMFTESNKESTILNKKEPIKFTLGKLINLNQNICIEVKSKELEDLQQIYKRNCKKHNIKYDPIQSYHITLLKRNYKNNTYPMIPINELMKYEIIQLNYKLIEPKICTFKEILSQNQNKETKTKEKEITYTNLKSENTIQTQDKLTEPNKETDNQNNTNQPIQNKISIIYPNPETVITIQDKLWKPNEEIKNQQNVKEHKENKILITHPKEETIMEMKDIMNQTEITKIKMERNNKQTDSEDNQNNMKTTQYHTQYNREQEITDTHSNLETNIQVQDKIMRPNKETENQIKTNELKQNKLSITYPNSETIITIQDKPWKTIKGIKNKQKLKQIDNTDNQENIKTTQISPQFNKEENSKNNQQLRNNTNSTMKINMISLIAIMSLLVDIAQPKTMLLDNEIINCKIYQNTTDTKQPYDEIIEHVDITSQQTIFIILPIIIIILILTIYKIINEYRRISTKNRQEKHNRKIKPSIIKKIDNTKEIESRPKLKIYEKRQISTILNSKIRKLKETNNNIKLKYKKITGLVGKTTIQHIIKGNEITKIRLDLTTLQENKTKLEKALDMEREKIKDMEDYEGQLIRYLKFEKDNITAQMEKNKKQMTISLHKKELYYNNKIKSKSVETKKIIHDLTEQNYTKNLIIKKKEKLLLIEQSNFLKQKEALYMLKQKDQQAIRQETDTNRKLQNQNEKIKTTLEMERKRNKGMRDYKEQFIVFLKSENDNITAQMNENKQQMINRLEERELQYKNQEQKLIATKEYMQELTEQDQANKLTIEQKEKIIVIEQNKVLKQQEELYILKKREQQAIKKETNTNKSKIAGNRTIIVIGMILIGALIIKPCKAGLITPPIMQSTTYPYTHITKEYKPYMKPVNKLKETSNLLNQNIQIMTENDILEKNERESLLTKYHKPSWNHNPETDKIMSELQSSVDNLPNTILNYAAAVVFIIERNRETLKTMKDEIRTHTIKTIQYTRELIKNNPRKRNRRQANQVTKQLVDNWNKDDDINHYLDIPTMIKKGTEKKLMETE